ncbi:MAG: alpha amylase N-terminal ig-like domain-containing protein [bacterium]|nr:alpha amylase N-terminal ig-like domain-containing protein [bacterium]
MTKKRPSPTLFALILIVFLLTALPRAPQAAAAPNASLDNNVFWNEVLHNTRDSSYRAPFGAVPTGQPITIRLRTAANDLSNATLVVYNVNTAVDSSGTLWNVQNTRQATDGTYDTYEFVIPASPDARTLYYKFRLQDGSDCDWYIDNYAHNSYDHEDRYENGTGMMVNGLTGNPCSASGRWLRQQLLQYHRLRPERLHQSPGYLGGQCRYLPDFARPLPQRRPGQRHRLALSHVYGSPINNHTAWNEPVEDARVTNGWSRDFFGGDLQGWWMSWTICKRRALRPFTSTPSSPPPPITATTPPITCASARVTATTPVQYWYSLGADGWRFDVADEISHSFWTQFRAQVKNNDALNGPLYSEVWYEATPWLYGDQLDATMNYRYRKAVLGFLIDATWTDNDNNGDQTMHALSASEFDYVLGSIREDYPAEAWYSMMNLMDSHDTNRALFVLREQSTDLPNALAKMEDDGRASIHLPRRAHHLLWRRSGPLARAIMAATPPGAPANGTARAVRRSLQPPTTPGPTKAAAYPPACPIPTCKPPIARWPSRATTMMCCAPAT